MQFVNLSRNGESEIEDDGDDEFAAEQAYSLGVARGQLSGRAAERERFVARELACPGTIAAYLGRTPVTRGVSADDRQTLTRVFGATPAVAPRRRETTSVGRRERSHDDHARPLRDNVGELIASLERMAGIT